MIKCKGRKGLVLVVALLITASAFSTTLTFAVKAQQPSWTIMVYMAADNNLEAMALTDLDEMERAHPGGGVEVVALVDRSDIDYEYYNVPPNVLEVVQNTQDWTDAKILRITPDDSPGIKSQVLQDLGEVDTGDPNVLKQFIQYVIQNFPARNYMLIIWDHGGGPGGAAWDDSNGEDYLTLKEMRAAIEEAGVHFTIIGFDACLMATIDAAYEFRNVADYMVASEETEPGDGWPYDYWLSKLVSDPSMSPSDLAKTIVDEYIRYYTETGEEGVTLSAIQLAPLRDQNNLNTILDFVTTAINNPDPVRQARMNVQTFGGGDDPVYGANQVDLIDLLNKVSAAEGSSATALANFIQSLVIESKNIGYTVSNANGLSAHYPLRYDRSLYVQETSFASDMRWADLLDVVVNVVPEISTEPVQNIPAGGARIKLYTDYDIVSATFGAGGPLEFDGDGNQEFLVFSQGADSAGTYYMLLSISKYFPGEGLYEVYSDEVDYGYELSDGSSPFVMAGAMSGDVDNDGMEEFFDVYSYVDFDTEYIYTSIDRYEYAGEQTVDSYYNLIDDLIAMTADLGDFNNDGIYEIAIGGYDINFTTYSMNGSLYIVDAETLDTIVSFYFDSPEGNFTEVAELAAGDVDADGWTELIIGYNVENMDSYGNTEPVAGKVAVTYMDGEDIYSMDLIEVPNAKIVSVATGDLDSDGADEVVFVVQYSDGSLALDVYKWEGDSMSMIGEWSISAENALAFVQTYDLDGDGILELLLTVVEYDYSGSPSSVTLDIYSYIPSQEDFQYENTIDMTGEFTIPVPTDLDGDGTLDVVFIEQMSDGIYLSLGQVSNYVNPTGTIKGQVVDANGKPVPNAFVEVMLPRATYYANTTTDENGYFQFTNVPAGTYQINAYWLKPPDQIGYASKLVNVPVGETVEVTLTEVTGAPSGGGENATTTTTTPPPQTTTTTPPETTTTPPQTTTTTQPTTTTTPPQTATTTTTPPETTTSTPPQTTTTQPTTSTAPPTTITTTTTEPHTTPPTTTTYQPPTTTQATTLTTPPPEVGIDFGQVGMIAAVVAVIVIVGAVLALRARRPKPSYMPVPPPPPA